MSCCDCHLTGKLTLNENLEGLFNPQISLQGLYILDSEAINLRGTLLLTENLTGRLDQSDLLTGIYRCIPTGVLDCFNQLDFSRACNSAHVVSAGF